MGIYYLTRAKSGVKGEGMVFADPEEVRSALDSQAVDLHAKIKVRIEGQMKEKCRVMLYEVIPETISFDEINKVMKKKELADLTTTATLPAGDKTTVLLADRLKDIGFEYATRAGVLDCNPQHGHSGKQEGDRVARADKDVLGIQKQYMDGLITHGR